MSLPPKLAAAIRQLALLTERSISRTITRLLNAVPDSEWRVEREGLGARELIRSIRSERSKRIYREMMARVQAIREGREPRAEKKEQEENDDENY